MTAANEQVISGFDRMSINEADSGSKTNKPDLHVNLNGRRSSESSQSGQQDVGDSSGVKSPTSPLSSKQGSSSSSQQQPHWSVNMMSADVKDRILNFQKSRQRNSQNGYPGSSSVGGTGSSGSSAGAHSETPSRHNSQTSSTSGTPLMSPRLQGPPGGNMGDMNASSNGNPTTNSSHPVHSPASPSTPSSPVPSSFANFSTAQALAAAATAARLGGAKSPEAAATQHSNNDGLSIDKVMAETRTQGQSETQTVDSSIDNQINKTNESISSTDKISAPTSDVTNPSESKLNTTRNIDAPSVLGSQKSISPPQTPHGALYSNSPSLRAQGKPSLSQRRGFSLAGGPGSAPPSPPNKLPGSETGQEANPAAAGPPPIPSLKSEPIPPMASRRGKPPGLSLANLRAGANPNGIANPVTGASIGVRPGGRPSLRGGMPAGGGQGTLARGGAPGPNPLGPSGNKGGSISESAIDTGGSLLSSYVQYIDVKTGSLNFAGKASVHANGIEFSSGSSFRISLDELENKGELGRGNYGEVTKVLHKPTQVMMAMKEIRLELEEIKFRQILMELEILHKCNSPYIVDFYGAFFVEGAVYLCMEYMDGGSLNKIYSGGIAEEYLAKIADAVVQGLRQLKDEHNIIHRDVKPTNILVSTSGKIKLCDFGVSGNLVASIARTNVGCQSYMAPERIRSKNPNEAITYTVESDIWSLGLSLIETASGKYPYPAETYGNIFSQLSAIVDGEPPRLPESGYSALAQDFVAKCLDKNPKKRPTYAALFEHPWLVKYRDVDVQMGDMVKAALARSDTK